MVALLTGAANRYIAWALLGGGALIVLGLTYGGGHHKGVIAEAAKWQAIVAAKREADRAINFQIDQRSTAEGQSLADQEQAIRLKWQTIGREGSK